MFLWSCGCAACQEGRWLEHWSLHTDWNRWCASFHKFWIIIWIHNWGSECEKSSCIFNQSVKTSPVDIFGTCPAAFSFDDCSVTSDTHQWLLNIWCGKAMGGQRCFIEHSIENSLLLRSSYRIFASTIILPCTSCSWFCTFVLPPAVLELRSICGGRMWGPFNVTIVPAQRADWRNKNNG